MADFKLKITVSQNLRGKSKGAKVHRLVGEQVLEMSSTQVLIVLQVAKALGRISKLKKSSKED